MSWRREHAEYARSSAAQRRRAIGCGCLCATWHIRSAYRQCARCWSGAPAGAGKSAPPASAARSPEIERVFEDAAHIIVIESTTVIPEAAVLAARYRVKGADAVHIAAARRVHRRVVQGEEFWFVSADLRQAEAAREEGMRVLDPMT